MTWFIRKAEVEDKERIIGFFKSSIWTPKESKELYSWKYEDNPSGSALIWLAVEEKDDGIVGVSVMMPWKTQVCGNTVVPFQGVDGFVDRNYRRQGIHTALIKQTLSEFREMRVPFIFAFPNEKSGPSLSKIGWREVGLVRRWAKSLKTENTLSKVIGRNVISKSLGFFIDVWLRLISRERYYHPSSKYVIKEIKEFDERFDVLWERVSSNFKVIGVRDSKYLNWKYINNPISTPNVRQTVFSIEKDNNLAGYIVLELGFSPRTRRPEISYIVDIFTEQDDELINHLITYIVKYLRSQGILVVSFIALEDNLYVSYLKGFGFHLRPDRSPFVIVYTNPDSSNRAILSDHKNWFITDGDWDMISH